MYAQPSLKDARIGYVRGILSEKKLHLEQNVVNLMKVPLFQKISDKNLYTDAMTVPRLPKHLPNPY